MKFKKIFKKYGKVVQGDSIDVFQKLARLMEEVGELSVALLVEADIKNKDLDEKSSEECIDVIATALSIFFQKGGNHDVLKALLEDKLEGFEKKEFV